MSAALPPLSAAAQSLRPGRYRHYKGGEYFVQGVARHTEDPSQELVVYQSAATGEWWARPVTMFVETVEHDGRLQPRFAWFAGAT